MATFRDRFRIPPDGPIYLDGNSLGRPSHAVVDAIAAGIESWERELVGGWSRWINLPIEVGDRLGVLLGAGPGQVLICDSTTVNLFKLADAALRLQRAQAGAGRAVIVGDANDFPTDRYVLAGLAEARGCELRLVASDPVNGVGLDGLRGRSRRTDRPGVPVARQLPIGGPPGPGGRHQSRSRLRGPGAMRSQP